VTYLEDSLQGAAGLSGWVFICVLRIPKLVFDPYSPHHHCGCLYSLPHAVTCTRPRREEKMPETRHCSGKWLRPGRPHASQKGRVCHSGRRAASAHLIRSPLGSVQTGQPSKTGVRLLRNGHFLPLPLSSERILPFILPFVNCSLLAL